MLPYEISGDCRRKRRGGKRAVWLGVLLAVLVPLFYWQTGSAWARQGWLTYGAMWQGILSPAVESDGRANEEYGVNYKKGEGVSFDVQEERPVKVEADGVTIVTRASFPKLDRILKETGVSLGPDDRVEAVFSASGTPEVKVYRVEKKRVTVEEPVPAAIKEIEDLFLPPGRKEVRQPGEDGVRQLQLEVTYENGREVSRRTLNSRIIKESVARQVAVGVQVSPSARRTASRGNFYRVTRELEVTATAYSYTGNPTASGISPYVGGVAVDPKVIPLGTRLYIEGYGPALAVDTGGMIKGRRIDLFFESEQECLDWGRKKVKVYCLR